MTDSAVRLDVADGVATITLNRPDVLNALDRALGVALVGAVAACAEDRSVRAVILTGAGRGFCAGGDIKAAWEYHQAGNPLHHYFRDVIVYLHRAILDMRRMPKPIIAAINGSAGGAGISLAGACDLRIAAEGAKFRQAYTALGLTPDGGWTALVAPLIGAAKAMELLLLDPKFDAAQAAAMGLVHEVVPDDAVMARARSVAARLANGPTTAYAGAKALINAALYPDLAAQLERERTHIIAQARTADFAEGACAFVEKRLPHFPGV